MRHTDHLKLLLPVAAGLLLYTCSMPIGDSLTTEKKIDRSNLKVLSLGNSIAGAPSDPWDWEKGHGFAASKPEKDYIHLLYDSLAKALNYEPQLVSVNAGNWERHFSSFDLTEWKVFREYHADLILIRAGDNIQGNIAVSDYLWKYFDRLLDYVAPDDNQVVISTGSWYPNRTVNTILKTVCEQKNISFIDIAPLYYDKSNQANSERYFEDKLSGEHPGDKGMAMIAAKLWKVIAPLLSE
jgi:hypothetical protein